MKIAEMEAHHDEYTALETGIANMLGNRDFPAVFSVCEASFQHIVPAIKYRKKRGIEPQTPELLSFSVVCKYGPPLFEHSVLASLLKFVRSTRLISKHENGYLESVEAALERQELARLLWNHLEHASEVSLRDIPKTLGVDKNSATTILEIWEELGVIDRNQEESSNGFCFRSRLNSVVEGICPACGVRGKGRKELFFKRISCKKCNTEGYYHILATDES